MWCWPSERCFDFDLEVVGLDPGRAQVDLSIRKIARMD